MSGFNSLFGALEEDEEPGPDPERIFWALDDGVPYREAASLPDTLPETLPFMSSRDLVVFPNMVVPIVVGKPRSVAALDSALAGKRLLFVSAARHLSGDEVEPDPVYTVGTVCVVAKNFRGPDGRSRVLLHGLFRGKISRWTAHEPFEQVRFSAYPDFAHSRNIQAQALVRQVMEQTEQLFRLNPLLSPDLFSVIQSIEDPGTLAYLVVANLGLRTPDLQKIYENRHPLRRLSKVLFFLNREISLLDAKRKIQLDAKGEIDRSQREYFLREQLKAIQKELGESPDGNDELIRLSEKIEESCLPPLALEEAERQMNRFSKLHSESSEAGVVRSYLEWLTDLPWKPPSPLHIDLVKAKILLDHDHLGLDKIKERILEYLAVRMLNPKGKPPILCFVGPPGVGKTSLGESVAKALKRPFIRISLGGIRDEAEIRGHRRTYVGALPGRILQGMRQAKVMDPVFMLDELDKVGTDFRGDPYSALLEVLDPEQNRHFSDHYLNLPYDLSGVLFLATANVLDTLPSPLLDRLEVIEIPGYTEEEKKKIARTHLWPRQRRENGIPARRAEMSDEALGLIIQEYTRESGVRSLERKLAMVCRKIAVKTLKGEKKKVRVRPEDLDSMLGHAPFRETSEIEKPLVGVVRGLAWTPTGGDLLFVEATLLKGKGILTITGKLGEVMQESAQAALTFVRSNPEIVKVPGDFWGKRDIHLHVPEGAIPKDGPSAGITMAVAIASAAVNLPVRSDIAMTGEITLRGRVLPIGGLKEKLLAARRFGMKEVIIPLQNERDLSEIPIEVRETLTITPVRKMEEVFERVFAPAQVPNHGS
ncbi:MAG: endopeptidase La [Leptospirales bacterium]